MPMNTSAPPSRASALLVGGTLAAAAGIALIGIGDPLSSYDGRTQAWLSDATVDAGKTYLAVRGLNAAVSVLKGSEFEVHPAGIGVSIAAGEVLDPLDDMTERLSDLLVLSTATVGVYRLLQPMVVVVSGFGVQLVLLALGAALLAQGARCARGHPPAGRLREVSRALALVGLMLLGLRIATPLAAGLGQVADARYLAPAEVEAIQTLRDGTPDVGRLTDPAPTVDEGWLSTMSRVGSRALDGAADVANAMKTLVANGESLIEALLTLFTLALTRLVLNAFILPLGCIWASWTLAKSLIRTSGEALR